MTKNNSVLKYNDDIQVAVNELVSSYTVNRNLKKLLDNDKVLYDLYIKVFQGLDISEYSENSLKSYDYGELVWFQDRSKKLWLLKCIIDENSNSPQLAIDDTKSYLNGNPNFEKYGWEDTTEFANIEIVVKSQLKKTIDSILEQHEESKEYHKFGKISDDITSPDYHARKILMNDFSNISETRKRCFYPCKTGHFTTDNILNGIYRVWDCGVIEFDLVFRVGYQYTDKEGNEVLSCNNVFFKQTKTRSQSSTDFQENDKYFNGVNDMRIFQNPEGVKTYQSHIGNIIQGNRNNFVNTYFAELKPFTANIKTLNGIKVKKFRDLNYMIYSGNMMANDSDYDDKTLEMNQNTMIYCNKTPDQVTAVYITIPKYGSIDNNFGINGGLAANSFCCHIIGRWEA